MTATPIDLAVQLQAAWQTPVSTSPEMTPEELNEYHWQNIPQRDVDYLTAPRNAPEPCVWCGGRLVHSEPCRELHAAWMPEMPFGKYKGQRLSAIPASYLAWVATRSEGIDEELRIAIRQLLRNISGEH